MDLCDEEKVNVKDQYSDIEKEKKKFEEREVRHPLYSSFYIPQDFLFRLRSRRRDRPSLMRRSGRLMLRPNLVLPICDLKVFEY